MFSNKGIDMKTTLIHPATFKLDGGAMFGIIPKPKTKCFVGTATDK